MCLLLPDFIALTESAHVLRFTIFPIAKISYAYAVVPIVLLVFFMSYIVKFYDKIIPNNLKATINPMMVIFTSVLVCILFIGPVSQYISDLLVNGFDSLYGAYPVIACAVIGLLYPILLSTGFSWVFVTMAITRLSTEGVDPFFLAITFNHCMALAGTAFGMFLMIKTKEERKRLMSYGITAFVPGVSEPMLFGICIPYKYPLLAVMGGSCITSVFQGIVSINAYIYAFPGIISIMMFSDAANPMNMIYALIAGAIGFVSGAVLVIIIKTFIFNKR